MRLSEREEYEKRKKNIQKHKKKGKTQIESFIVEKTPRAFTFPLEGRTLCTLSVQTVQIKVSPSDITVVPSFQMTPQPQTFALGSALCVIRQRSDVIPDLSVNIPEDLSRSRANMCFMFVHSVESNPFTLLSS